ncbi:MAG: TRAP transporter substrate-binding protein [Treponema sp.]|nr:TRAP transporter substrate-binding protein [Treponema sp.]
MKKRHFALPVLLLIGVVMVFGGCAGDDGTFTLRLAHGNPETDPVHPAAVDFARIVEERTEGRVRIQVFSNSVLGDEVAIVRSVIDGSIDIGIVTSAAAQASTPSIGAMIMPYMFTSTEQAWHVMDNVLPRMNERLIDEGNFRVLAFYEKGFRVLTNSVRPVRTLEDLQGLRIRVTPARTPMESFRAFGIEPIPMAWAEVFTALQQGVVDGQENPHTTNIASRFHEVQTYVTDIHYMMWVGPLFISERTFQRLPDYLQTILIEAAHESAVTQRHLHAILVEEAKVEAVELGMVLVGPPTDEPEWQRRAQSIWPELYDSAGGREWVHYVLSLIP